MRKMIFKFSLSLAALCLSGAAVAGYTCKTPEKNPNWCQCVHEYMSSENGMCYKMGGDRDTCKDESIRQFVHDFGGPVQTCAMIDDTLQPLCMAVLPRYVASCPPVAG